MNIAFILPGFPFAGGFRRGYRLFFGLVMALLLSGPLYGENGTSPSSGKGDSEEKQNASLGFLWSGSWENEGNLVNRGDLKLHIPWQDLGLRAQVTDKRPANFNLSDFSVFLEELGQGNTSPGGGLYHGPSGSRVLYGILDEWGLPARVRNPWIRAVPLTEAHNPSLGDLKTEPSSTKSPETYLYLGLPRLGPFSFFGSLLLDEGLNPSAGGGLTARFDGKTSLGLEGFYTEKKLPPGKASAWFSRSPPLPERDFRLYALALVFNSPFFGAASDWAYSETFAYGRDLYGNAALRLGDRPWRLSLAADGAGGLYVGRDGSTPGAGFRLAGRLEGRGKGSSLFRLSTTLRAPGPGEPFDRSSSVIYYRFPVSAGNSPLSFSGISLTLNRNSQDREKIQDSFEAVLRFNAGPLRPVFKGALTGLTAAEETPLFFPCPDSPYLFESAWAAGELSYTLGFFQFKTKLGYTVKTERAPVWDAAFSAAIRGKWGRFSLKVESPEFPDAWTWELSWRVEKK
jgi:hypothetical protein